MKVAQFRLIADMIYVCVGLMSFTESPVGPTELRTQALKACGRQSFVSMADYVHHSWLPAVDRQQDANAVRVLEKMRKIFDGHTGDLSDVRAAVDKGKEVESDDGYSDDDVEQDDGE